MTTGIDEALIAWWESSETLCNLVPVEDVAIESLQVNEDSEDDTTEEDDNADGLFDDCVSITIATERQYQTNSGTGYQSNVSVSCMSADYDAAVEIGTAVISAWHRGTFTSAGAAIGLSLFQSAETKQNLTTGVWERVVVFHMNHGTI